MLPFLEENARNEIIAKFNEYSEKLNEFFARLDVTMFRLEMMFCIEVEC